MNWKIYNRSIAITWATLGIVAWFLSLFMVKEVFVGDAAIDIGTVGIFPSMIDERLEHIHSRPLEAANELFERLRAEYQVPEAKRKLIDMPQVFKLEVRAADVLRISARGSNPQEVEKLLNDVLLSVIDRHAELFDKAREEFNQRRRSLMELEETLKLQILHDRTDKVDRESKVNLPVLEKDQEKDSIIASVVMLDQARSVMFTRPTEVILQPQIRSARTQPKPILYFFTALVVALVGYIQTLGVFLLWKQRESSNKS